ncbi:MAG TPA: molybdopterin oxidoreductase [Bacteroidetes bacterium]|nr:molybdopterin oxidoreductase [Bacteroidota bacterium]HCN37312.1 molybdopterin oxidoreductase [Bacteroidota bacterium]
MGKSNNKYIDLSSEILKSDEKVNHENEKIGDKDIHYWRSFKELHNDPEFIRAKNLEFDKSSNKPFEPGEFSGFSRRKFLGLLAASASFAAAGCSNYRDKGEIIPYNKKPEEIVEGNPNFFASTINISGEPVNVLIKSREGRPIKVDGNPDSPIYKGKVNAVAQASILSLYDPDRIKNPKINNGSYGLENFEDTDWATVDNQIIKLLNDTNASGKDIVILSGNIYSPTFKKVLTEFNAKYPTAKVYTYNTSGMATKNSAWQKSYGYSKYPVVNYDKAKVILSLESDFLADDVNAIQNARKFARNREIINGDSFNRLYSVEGNVSLTGMNADYRFRLRTDAIEEFVLCLLNEFVNKRRLTNISPDASVASAISGNNLDQFVAKYNLNKDHISNLVEDLTKNQGASFVSGGYVLPESTHIYINLLNEVLGNRGLYQQLYYEESPLPFESNDIQDLINKLNSGSVGVLINFDVNPVYNLPGSMNFKDAMIKAGKVITMTTLDNETSSLSSYVLPINTDFESWGDFRSRVDFYSFQQPVLSPLFNTRQKEGLILNWINGNAQSYNNDIYHNYLKDNWEKNLYPGFFSNVKFIEFFFACLHDGVLPVNFTPVQLNAFTGSAASQITSGMKSSDKPVFLITHSPYLYDGTLANNGWLQEVPHPISRVVWDNYAAISPDTAKTLDVSTNDLIEIASGNNTIKLPVMIQPGMADNVIATELGYGREIGGTVGTDVGVNVNPFISKSNGVTEFLYNNIAITKSSGSYELISTQEHYPIDDPRYKNIQIKRHIIQEGTYNQYKKNPKSVIIKESIEGIPLDEFPSINPSINNPNTEGYRSTNNMYQGPVKWAMAIDMNKCIGCGQCVVSCNVENNIPVVGKEQVGKNREMMWLRIDRYYSGDATNPKANFQPMLCQHCDFAPCENVCPVLATSHSEDGINGMAYNRCVGTRYCSNNCPYKVRRFNYFNFRNSFNDGYQENEYFSLIANPEVTVRSRGVMEKCTFCVQRVMKARQVAIQEGRTVKGNDVITACQEACPTEAIAFGNMNDKEDNIQIYREHPLAYYLLEPIKVKPNVTYIAKLRNTVEELTHTGGDSH